MTSAIDPTVPASGVAFTADLRANLLRAKNEIEALQAQTTALNAAINNYLLLAGGTLTGPVSIAAGTAAAPGLSVAGDTDTGLYSPGANQLGISTGGVGRAIVDAVGALLWTVAPTVAGYVAQWISSHNSSQKTGIKNLNAGASAIAESIVETDAGMIRTALNSVAGGGNGTVECTAAGNFLVGSSHATGLFGGVAYGATRFTVTDVKFDLVAGVTYQIDGTQVMGARKTGWTAATGTATRTAFDTATVTTALLAQRVKALIDDLISHGSIGA